jgi:peptidoglycan/LPS O-acetylase OafA/YrhL
MERGERNINLDALRVFAILGVITLHLVGGGKYPTVEYW